MFSAKSLFVKLFENMSNILRLRNYEENPFFWRQRQKNSQEKVEEKSVPVTSEPLQKGG